MVAAVGIDPIYFGIVGTINLGIGQQSLFEVVDVLRSDAVMR